MTVSNLILNSLFVLIICDLRSFAEVTIRLRKELYMCIPLPDVLICSAVLLCLYGQVVDTPDLSQINNMADKRRQVAKWKQMTSPGPSAILVAIPCDTRFKQVDYAAYEEVKNLWGDDSSFCGRLFIVFTYADRESRGMKKEAWYLYPELEKVLADAQYQHTKINNKASAEEKQSVVEGILLTVDEIGRFSHQALLSTKTRTMCVFVYCLHLATSVCSDFVSLISFIRHAFLLLLLLPRLTLLLLLLLLPLPSHTFMLPPYVL